MQDGKVDDEETTDNGNEGGDMIMSGHWMMEEHLI